MNNPYSITGSVLALVLMCLLTPGVAGGQDIASPAIQFPTEAILIPPLPDDWPTPPPAPFEEESVPSLVHLDPAAFAAAKIAALHDLAYGPPDSVLIPAGQASEGATTSIRSRDDDLRFAVANASVVRQFSGLAWDPNLAFTPSDANIGKSGQRVLEAVNKRIRLTDQSGALLDEKTLQDFFGATYAPFDPKVFSDRNATNRRLYAIAIENNTNPRVSNIRLAVSQSVNPSNLAASGWCRYSIPALWDVGTPDESRADYPSIGVSATRVTITTRQFRVLTSGFTRSVIRAFDKLPMANNATACPTIGAYVFQTEPIGDLNDDAIHPVQHYTNPSSFPGVADPAYMINAFGTPDDRYHVYRIRVLEGSGVLMEELTLTAGDTFTLPPDGPQSGGAVLLDTGDPRIRQAAGVGNAFWLAQATGCDIDGGANEACVRVLRIVVGDSGGVMTAALSQLTDFGCGANVHCWSPSIAVNASEQTALAFLKSSTSSFLSAGWTFKNLSEPNYLTLNTFVNGTCYRSETTPARTGDYVGGHTDTGLVSFWLATEYADTVSSNCRWRTSIIQIQP